MKKIGNKYTNNTFEKMLLQREVVGLGLLFKQEITEQEYDSLSDDEKGF